MNTIEVFLVGEMSDIFQKLFGGKLVERVLDSAFVVSISLAKLWSKLEKNRRLSYKA